MKKFEKTSGIIVAEVVKWNKDDFFFVRGVILAPFKIEFILNIKHQSETGSFAESQKLRLRVTKISSADLSNLHATPAFYLPSCYEKFDSCEYFLITLDFV